MSNLKKVVALECEGDWYVIPAEMQEKFNELSDEELNDNYDKQDEFNTLFGKYRTGGDLNLIQLYAEI